MALGLDATAHPSNGGNLTGSVNSGTLSVVTVATPVFSTGAGPMLFVALVGVDSGSVGYLPGTIINTSGLTWTKRVAFVDSTNSFGGEIWTAFSATGLLSTQTVTLTLSNVTTGRATFWLAVQVINGVPSTEAACIGNSNGFIDEIGVSTTVNVTVTPAGTGSWLIGHFGQANDTTVLVADGNTSAWDAQFTTTHTDNFAFGRYKSGGAVALTTAGTPVTFGSSTTDLFGFSAALEVKVSTGGGSSLTGTQSESATPSASFADAMAMPAAQAETATASASFASAAAIGAQVSESATASAAFAGAFAFGASQSESATASDAYAAGFAAAGLQVEATTPSVAFACSMAMGAALLETTIPQVLISGSGTTPIPGKPHVNGFYPWWYRLQPFVKRRIV